MYKSEARMIAEECLFIVVKSKDLMPSVYEYVADELDIKDFAIDEAFKKLFPDG